MNKPGRWIAGLTVGALFPFLLAVLHDVVKSPRPGESSFIFWRAAAIAALCALSEIYIGSVMVRTKHAGLAFAWLLLLTLLGVVLVPGVIADLEGVHVWQLFETRDIRLWWSIALVSLPSLAVVGCLAADRVSITAAATGLQGSGNEDDLILALTQERNQLADDLIEARRGVEKLPAAVARNGIVTLKAAKVLDSLPPLPSFAPGILDSHPQWQKIEEDGERCTRCATLRSALLDIRYKEGREVSRTETPRYSIDDGKTWTQDEPACIV